MIRAPRLTLPYSLGQALIDEATAAGGVEICGFFAESEANAARYVIANRAQRAADRFDMDAADQIAAFKQMRRLDARLIAIYHSHPTGEAKPSVHDARGHSYPRAAAIIVAPAAVHGTRVRAWQLVDDETSEQPIEWIDAHWREGFL